MNSSYRGTNLYLWGLGSFVNLEATLDCAYAEFMKPMFLFLFLFTVNAWSLGPQIGDSAEYKRLINGESGTRTILLKREILSYSQDDKTFLVQFGKNEGAGWKFWQESLLLLNYSYGLYQECPKHRGIYKTVTAKIGKIKVCERRSITSDTNNLDWHAEVPFGLIKQYYKDSAIEFETELIDYRLGP